MTRRTRTTLALAACAALALAACEQDASKTDLSEPKQRGRAIPQDYAAQAPDKITVWQNIDGHPTIAEVCIHGTAWRTVSSTHNGGFEGAVARVEEWDRFCPQPAVGG